MKISQIKPCSTDSDLKKTKQIEETPGDFTRLLAEESEKMFKTTESLGGGMQPVSLPSVGNYLPLGVERGFSDEYHRVALDVEGTINRLETLQFALQDPKGGMKSVKAAIGDLAASAGELQESVTGLPETHPLRRIAEELSILAHVESIKYKRGDYL
jgi:hypothetical protein